MDATTIDQDDNVIPLRRGNKASPFPKPRVDPESHHSTAPPLSEPTDSPIYKATIAAEAEMAVTAEFIVDKICKQKWITGDDLYVLPFNMREFLYGLERDGRLTVAKVAQEWSGCPRAGVGKIEHHVLPKNIKSWEEYKALDIAGKGRRRLVKKVFNYQKIAESAAKLSGVSVHKALSAVFSGTSYAPSRDDMDNLELIALSQLVAQLQLIPRYLDGQFPLKTYFGRLERHHILPYCAYDDGRMEVDKVSEFWSWHHYGLPQTKLGRCLVERKPIEAVVITSPCLMTNINWSSLNDAWEDANTQRYSAFANCYQILSIAVSENYQTIVLIENEITIDFGENDDIEVTSGTFHGLLSPGWHQIEVESSEGRHSGAWRVPGMEVSMSDNAEADRQTATAHVLDHAFLSKYVNGFGKLMIVSERPDIVINRGLPSQQTFGRSLVSYSWDGGNGGDSSFGWTPSLPAVLERALRADLDTNIPGGNGLIAEITHNYNDKVEAVNRWVNDLHNHITADLEQVHAKFDADFLTTSCIGAVP